MTNNTRNSSIELLRLLCMFSIVMHHFIISVISPDFASRVWTFFDLILHTAVVIFVLISGFYGIRFKLQKFANTVFTILLYSVSLTLIGRFFFSRGDAMTLVNSFLPISGGSYWFVTAYLELYLVAPFLNKLLEGLDRRNFLYFIGLLLFFVVYLGLFRHDPLFVGGKNLANFILIYSLGRFIRQNDVIPLRYYYFGTAIVICLFALICMLPHTHNLYMHGVAFAYQYNSPLNIILSVCLFNIVRSFNFSNSFINSAATSAFSVYLIHEHPIMREFIYVRPLEEYILPVGGSLFAVIFAVGLFACCLLIDRPRYYFYSAISSRFSNITFKS